MQGMTAGFRGVSFGARPCRRQLEQRWQVRLSLRESEQCRFGYEREHWLPPFLFNVMCEFHSAVISSSLDENYTDRAVASSLIVESD